MGARYAVSLLVTGAIVSKTQSMDHKNKSFFFFRFTERTPVDVLWAGHQLRSMFASHWHQMRKNNNISLFTLLLSLSMLHFVFLGLTRAREPTVDQDAKEPAHCLVSPKWMSNQCNRKFHLVSRCTQRTACGRKSTSTVPQTALCYH